MNFRKFFAELKRRNVYKVAVAYAVVAWLKVEPMYDPLRSNPRFQALYKKMNFPP